MESLRKRNEAYLDNAATTKVFDSVKSIMVKTLEEDYGNPSSMHLKGMQAENYIKEAKEIIAKSLKVEEKEIIFTSGGTESNNHALIGTAFANKRAGNHIITTRIEHPSVYNPLMSLQDFGFEISYLEVDHCGRVNMEQLIGLIKKETIIVSIMLVNNEIGAVQDVANISKRVKEKNPNLLFHVDAIQAFGKYQIYPKRLGIDLLSISGHKIHGPKGSGVLYIRDKVKVKPIIFGGEQQKGMRSGTENVPAIAGLGQAVKEIYQNHEEKIRHLYELKAYFINGVRKIEDVTVNGIDFTALNNGNGNKTSESKESVLAAELNSENKDNLQKKGTADLIKEVTADELLHNKMKSAPHIVSVSFNRVRSEVLLHALEERKIYVSSGSACSSNHPSISGTLTAIGVKKELLDSTIRFSFSVNTTIEEIDYALNELKEIVPRLRKYTRN